MSSNWKSVAWGTQLWRNLLIVQGAIALGVIISRTAGFVVTPNPWLSSVWQIVLAMAWVVVSHCWSRAPISLLSSGIFKLLAHLVALGYLANLLLLITGTVLLSRTLVAGLQWAELLMMLLAIATLRSLLIQIRSSVASMVKGLGYAVLLYLALLAVAMLVGLVLPGVAVLLLYATLATQLAGIWLLILFVTHAAKTFDRQPTPPLPKKSRFQNQRQGRTLRR